MNAKAFRFFVMTLLAATTPVAGIRAQEQVTVANGRLEGTLTPSGVRSFKGIPFAQPPLGELRWKPPQPPTNWAGLRKADHFGPRAMQQPIYGDMAFRSAGMSEDCLYLNVWTPAKPGAAKLPVLVYFYGGGFVAGDGSEPRYDGESMAGKGLVTVTVNYRLGVFGFLAHPELTQESPHHASGNYALLDQHAALEWVNRNIAAFGGDPRRVTLAGESAGSLSVSALMASPLSKGLMAGAIGESGSILATLAPSPLSEAEAGGLKFAAGLGLGARPTLAALRALPAADLLRTPANPGAPWCKPTLDGYFFPKHPREIYAAGEQAHVPLLAGVNSEESGSSGVLGTQPPTVENYRQALRPLYADQAQAVFNLYPAATETEVLDSAQALAGDRFISYGTWKWVDAATQTGGQPTYYYLFSRPRPPMRPEMGAAVPGLAGGVIRDAPSASAARPRSRGAVHSAEIEYALGNLDLNKVYAWTPDDYQVSKVMQEYFANFIKTGNPNGRGLPEWPQFRSGQRLVLDVNPHAESQGPLRTRYEFLDRFYVKP